MAPLSSYTLIALARRLAREIGAIVAEGTAGSVTTTTVVDTANLLYPTDSDYKGFQVVLLTAGGSAAAGTTRYITASTASSSTITFPTITGLSGTPDYMVLNPSKAILQDLYDAIRASIENVLNYHATVKYNAELRVNDLTHGQGDMERGSATSVPTGWGAIGASTFTQTTGTNANMPHQGADFGIQYSSAMLNAASSVGGMIFRPTSRDFQGYSGAKFKFIAMVKASTASRARLQLEDQTTVSNSSYHTGGSAFEELSVSATMANPTADLLASIRIETGSAITVYADTARLLSQSVPIRSYVLPSGFLSLSEVWIGGDPTPPSHEFDWLYRVPDGQWWVIKGASNPRLEFTTMSPLIEDRRLLLVGNSYITVPSAATDNIDINPAYVLAGAKAHIHRSRHEDATADRYEREARILRDDLTWGLLPNAKIIEGL